MDERECIQNVRHIMCQRTAANETRVSTDTPTIRFEADNFD